MKATSIIGASLFALVLAASRGWGVEAATSQEQKVQYLRKASFVKDQRELQSGRLIILVFDFFARVLGSRSLPVAATTPTPATTTSTTTQPTTNSIEPGTTSTTTITTNDPATIFITTSASTTTAPGSTTTTIATTAFDPATTSASTTTTPGSTTTTTALGPVTSSASTTTTPGSTTTTIATTSFGPVTSSASTTTTPGSTTTTIATTSFGPVTSSASTTTTPGSTTTTSPTTTSAIAPEPSNTTPKPATTTTTTTTVLEPATTATTTTATTTMTSTAEPITTTTTGAPLISSLDTIRALSANAGDKFSIALRFIEAATSLANDLSQNSGPFTGFIPTDDQLNVLFTQLSIEGSAQTPFGRVVVDPTCIISAGSIVVDALLEYFIVEGALIKEADFTNGPLTTRSGGIIDVDVDGGEVTLISNPNSEFNSSIASFDNLASNGVVHELAGILSPPISDDLRYDAGLACLRFF